jgi:hypothetical protein
MGGAGTMGAAGMGAAGMTGGAGMTGAAGVTGTAGMNGMAGAMGTAGMPAPACGPKTCVNGCCDASGKCVTNRSPNSCGSGGGACVSCGSCMLCSAGGTCDLDPSSVWDVICDRATIDPTQPNGATWDYPTATDGAAPDPFCVFEMPANTTNDMNQKFTSDIRDTFTPVWNTDVTPQGRPIKASDLMTKTWRAWTADDDGCGVHGCFAQELCEITNPASVTALTTGQLTVKNTMSCQSFTIRFVCAQ